MLAWRKYTFVIVASLILTVGIFLTMSKISTVSFHAPNMDSANVDSYEEIQISGPTASPDHRESLEVISAEKWKPLSPPYQIIVSDSMSPGNPHEKYAKDLPNPSPPALEIPKIELLGSDETIPFCHGRYGPRYSPFLSGTVNKSGSCEFELRVDADGRYKGVEWIKCSDETFKEVSLKNIEFMYTRKIRKECFTVRSKITYRLMDEDGNIIPE